MKKKKPSWSIRILFISSTVLLTFTAIVLAMLAIGVIEQEPSTLILSFFGAFGATQFGNVFLNGIKQKSEAKMQELQFAEEPYAKEFEDMPCERTLAEMQETYLGGAEK